MPTVPVVDQTAMPGAQYTATRVQPMENYAPQQQVTAGQAAQGFGEMVMKTGQTIGDALAAQVDDAATKQAEISSLQKVNDLLHGEKGYYNLRGQEAIDAYASTKQAVVKAFHDNLESLTNPIQKQMFQQVMQQHLLSIGSQMDQHNSQATRDCAGKAAADRSNIYSQSAAGAYSSYWDHDQNGKATGDFTRNLGIAEKEALTAAQLLEGFPPGSATANNYLLRAHMQIAAGVVSNMLASHAPPARVREIYEDMKSKGWMQDGSDFQLNLGEKVKSYADDEEARLKGHEALSDAARAAAKQPTSSTGTPDYSTPFTGVTATTTSYSPEAGGVLVTLPNRSDVNAPASGKIVQEGMDDEGHLSVKVQHPDGSVTTLAGLSSSAVRLGDEVQGGQRLGSSGALDGGNSGGGVMWSLKDKNGNAVDPLKAGLPAVDINSITDEGQLQDAVKLLRSRITDQNVQDKAVNEVVNRVRFNQANADALSAQRYRQASDSFYQGGQKVSAIPPDLFYSLTPTQQSGLRELEKQHTSQVYENNQRLKTMDQVSQLTHFTKNPAQLTQDNVDQAYANGHLSYENYSTLSAQIKQNNINAQVLANGQVDQKQLTELLYQNQLGYLADPHNKKDKMLLLALTQAVSREIGGTQAKLGRTLTQEESAKAIRDVIVDKVYTPGFFGAGDMKVYSTLSDAEKADTTVWVGKAGKQTKVRIADIPLKYQDQAAMELGQNKQPITKANIAQWWLYKGSPTK